MKQMRRLLTILTIMVVALSAAGCEALLAALFGEPPATPLEQVNAFLAAASAETRDNEVLRSYFDPAADDYPNMLLDSYWEVRFFNATDGPYTLLNGAEGGENTSFPGSTTVNGNVTNFVNSDPGYTVLFTLTTDPENKLADPLIRRIEVTVAETTEVITRIVQ